jgi:hypothetical protein
MIIFVQGSQKTLIFRFRDQFDNPIDLTNYAVLNFCFPGGNADVHKKRVIITGTISNGSPIVTATDTTELAIGDLVAGANIPLGSTVLTVDSSTQFTMTQNATANATESLTIGDVTFNGDPLLGACSVVLEPADSLNLPADQPIDVQCKTELSGVINFVQFLSALQQTSSVCT